MADATDDEPVTTPAQTDAADSSAVDNQISNELASSPTAQGGGPAPDANAPQLAGISFKGGTEHGKKYAAGVFGSADRAVDQFSAQDSAQRLAEEQQNARDYADARKALGGEVTATTDFQKRQDELDAQTQAFYQHAAATEERMNGEAKAERQRYISQYQEQLSAVRALALQSGNPIGQMSTGQALGLAGAEFAQGFLAARGIHIDVTGQVDRWVDRSIQEHQMKIQNARASAEDSLHLYEIARQNSQDDWEARQRYRGFVIAGLQSAIQSNATRFQSNIAMARAQEGIAKLQIDADATQRSIADNHFNRTLNVMKTEYQKAFEMGKLGIEEQKLQLMKDKNSATAGALPITDPRATTRDPTTGKVKSTKIVAAIRGDLKPELQNEIMKQVIPVATTYSQVGTAFDRLRKLRAPAYDDFAEKFGPRAGEMFSEAQRAYRREARGALMDARHAIAGSNLTENEKKEWDAMLPGESLFQKGNNAAAIDQLEMHFRDKYEATINSIPGIIPMSGDKPYIDEPNDTTANYNASMNGKAPLEGSVGAAEGEAAKGSHANNAPSTKAYQKAVGIQGEQPELSDTTKRYLGGAGAPNASMPVMRTPVTQAAPHWTEGMNKMARAVVDPGSVIAEHFRDNPEGAKSEKPEQVTKDGMKRLEVLANDKSIPKDRRAYAAYLVKRLKEDPQGVLDDLAPDESDTLADTE